ncbi:hypothetical protein BDZ91DRAFT_460204 [Kalaharituber pfeilii]|nr:hypothetical protein BDZ91DRAFT_460204 [Kalaharituber pfeilii]
MLKTHLANHLIDIASFTFPSYTSYEDEAEDSSLKLNRGTIDNVSLDNEAYTKLVTPALDELVMNELQTFASKNPGIHYFYPNGFRKAVLVGTELASYISSELDLSPEIAAQASVLALYDIIMLLDDSTSMEFEQNGTRKTILWNTVHIIARFCSSNEVVGGIRRVSFLNSPDTYEHVTAKKVMEIMGSHEMTGLSRFGHALHQKILKPHLYGDKAAVKFTQDKPQLILLLCDGQPEGESRQHLESVLKNSVNAILSGKAGNGPASIVYQILQIGNDKGAKGFLDEIATLPVPFRDYITTDHIGPELQYRSEDMKLPPNALLSIIKILLKGVHGATNSVSHSLRGST